MKSTVFAATLSLLSFLSFSQASKTPDALMLRFPDVSEKQITFVYAEDVWVVPIEGGLARRVTSSDGMEYYPKFSPDGKTIAFSGNYDGNYDVYTIQSQGSAPFRLTYHPGNDRVIDWKPDGSEVLFASGRESPSNRFNQFYTIKTQSGNPEKLPLFFAELGSYNADGSQLAYQFLNRTNRTWKRYQGGTASDIYLFDFASGKSTQITDYSGTDALPMWHGDKIYFLSDRGENYKANIWSYNTATKSFAQETFFEEYDVKFPSVGPNHIVMENGGKLHLLDLQSGETKVVSVQVPSEQLAARTEWKDLSKSVNSFFISNTGKRALFEARGEVFTVPAKDGITLNLTHSSNAHEQHPNWSPDGESIAYFSDESGEYQLMIRPADGTGEAKKITSLKPGYYTGTLWSPDSKKIAFTKFDGTLYYIDVTTKKVTEVDRSNMSRIRDYSWSSDSKWLTYSKSMDYQNSQIVVYSLNESKATILTGTFYNCTNPVFSRDGKYIFYSSNRNFSPNYSDFDGTWVYDHSGVLMASTLSKDEKSLLTPKNDQEEIKKEEKNDDSEKKDTKKKDDEKKDDAPEIKIDAEGFESRAVIIPTSPGGYWNIQTSEGKVVYTYVGKDGKGDIKYWDIKDQKEETIMSGAFSYEISADGKKLMYSKGQNYAIVDVQANQKEGDGTLNLSDVKAQINPMEEWAQIYNEAWRLERDFFYDPNMHGVNWEDVGTRYRKLLPFCTSRSDLNYIIGEMIGELNVGHAYVGGGDQKYAEFISVGMLGADISIQGEAIRIDKIQSGAPWDINSQSPLQQAGVSVEEGEFITAINHLPVKSSVNPYAPFQGLNGKVVILTVAKDAKGTDSRDVEIKLLSNESRLRNLAWIESNRQKVLKATNGMCGYIYVPNTGVDGQSELMRMYQGQSHMKAMIIDERWNSGGQIPDRFVELLNRPIRSHFSRRDLLPMNIPFNGMNGPRVMLANQWAGSGGDMFPYIFKQEKVGPVVGKRTWGGLVGISGIPPLVDNGFLTAPNFAFFNLDGNWDVEGYGVDPDYEVDAYPEDMFMGLDAQLDKAIELINADLKANPPKEVKQPQFPNKTGIGNPK